jgi:thioredoxin-related protein
MKTSLLHLVIITAIACVARADAPEMQTDMRKALSAAAKDQKMAFILLGRASCGNCNATKAMIREGKIPVTAAECVVADLNIDDPKTEGQFMRKYGKEKFGETLPFVAVTDSHGKLLASSGGYKAADRWTELLTEARNKAAAKASGTPAK